MHGIVDQFEIHSYNKLNNYLYVQIQSFSEIR